MVVSNILYFHLYLGKIPIWLIFFSKGLKPPTRYTIPSPWESVFFFAEKNWQAVFQTTGADNCTALNLSTSFPGNWTVPAWPPVDPRVERCSLALASASENLKNPATSPRWFCFRVEDFSTYSVFFLGGEWGACFFSNGWQVKINCN